jgi:hypothetical protein
MPTMIGRESLAVVGARVEVWVDLRLNPRVDRRSATGISRQNATFHWQLPLLDLTEAEEDAVPRVTSGWRVGRMTRTRKRK